MKKVFITIAILNLLELHSQEFGMPNNDPHYEIFWEDNFNSNTLSTSKWNIDIGVVSTNGGDPNPGYCTARQTNVKIVNGQLNLVALREDYIGYKFTGGSITSQTNFNVGCYIESYLKLANGNNVAAFWTWEGDGSCNQWLDYREIDIIEWFGDDLLANYAVPYCKAQGLRGTFGGIGQSLTNPSVHHNFSTYWTSNNITIYSDHKPVTEGFSISSAPNPNALRSSMKINLWNIKHDWYVYPLNSTFEIDYVRVWRLKECDNLDITQISNFNTFNYTVKRSYSLSNTTTFPTNANVSLRATNFIELKNGFELSGINRDIILNTNICD